MAFLLLCCTKYLQSLKLNLVFPHLSLCNCQCYCVFLSFLAVRHCSIDTGCFLSSVWCGDERNWFYFFLFPPHLPNYHLGQLEYCSRHAWKDSVRSTLLFVLVDKQLGYCNGPGFQSHTVCLTDPRTGSPGRFSVSVLCKLLNAIVSVFTHCT